MMDCAQEAATRMRFSGIKGLPCAVALPIQAHRVCDNDVAAKDIPHGLTHVLSVITLLLRP